jgi:pilus assembly protein CpaB
MGRRTVLLLVAALIAALGAGMVFLYVRGADSRAEANQQPVQVLKAVAQINPGETLAAAQAAGKVALGTVPKAQVLTGAVNSTSGLDDKVALATIYPNEQIITGKFGTSGDQETLQIPDGDIAISVSLGDTGRVAGFVSPGAKVAIFTTAADAKNGDGIRLLLSPVEVIAVGTTTIVPTQTTDATGAQTTEQLPKTLFTLAVNQDQAQRIMYAVNHGALTFGLLNDKSQVKPGPGISASNLFR